MLTNTQFIRQAALRGGPITAGNKVIEYPDIECGPVEDAHCWLCGGDTKGTGLPIKKGIKPTFTDHDIAKDMTSQSLCSGCAFCLGRSLRNYSLLATEDKLIHPGRAELRDILLTPPEPPFLLAIAVSGQKHLSFKAHISFSRDLFPVLLEEMLIPVTVVSFKELLEPIEILYTEFSKAEIESGNYRQDRIKMFGPGRWESIESQIAGQRGTRLFNLAVFVARKPDMQEVVPGAAQKEVSTIRFDGSQAALF